MFARLFLYSRTNSPHSRHSVIPINLNSHREVLLPRQPEIITKSLDGIKRSGYNNTTESLYVRHLFLCCHLYSDRLTKKPEFLFLYKSLSHKNISCNSFLYKHFFYKGIVLYKNIFFKVFYISIFCIFLKYSL